MTFIERVVPGESSSRGELAAHVQRYKFAAPLVQAKRVLDAGCGSGYGAKLLRDAGASGVVAVDISHEAIGSRANGTRRMEFNSSKMIARACLKSVAGLMSLLLSSR